MKIIRLIANIFTVPEIGQHIYRERPNDYRQLIKQLKALLEKKANIEKASVKNLYKIGISSLCLELFNQYSLLWQWISSRQQWL